MTASVPFPRCGKVAHEEGEDMVEGETEEGFGFPFDDDM